MDSHFDIVSPSRQQSIRVDPEAGGRLQSLDVEGSEILVGDGASSLDWGLYPMVPFAGRLRGGLLNFEREQTRLPATNGPHAIHGYGFVQPWKQVDDATISFEFSEPWPWRGRTIQRFDLTDHSLNIEMTVEAVDRQPMQIGWHPWFVRDIGNGSNAALDFSPTEMFVRDVSGIPTGETVTPTAGPWDDCFAGLSSNPRITWGHLQVELSSSLGHWTVYDEPRHALCVEPQLGPPNALNTEPLVLDAGEQLTHWFRIGWTEVLGSET